MKKGRLIFFAIIIIAVLTLSIYVLLRKDNPNNESIMAQSSDFKGNTEQLVDFGANVIRYGKNVYFIDEKQNLLLKYNPEKNLTSIVCNFRNFKYGKRFFIRNNNLIFSYGNNTYYSDLDGYGFSKMCNGEVVYINNDIYLYILHGDSRDELYITSYDNTTLKQTLEVSKNIAKGTTIEYLKSSDDEVFFTSKNLDNTISLFEVDIKNSKVSVINKRDGNASAKGHRLEYSNVIKTDELYYYIVDEIAETTNEDAYVSSSLYVASKEYYYSEFYDNNVGKYLAYNKKNKNEIIYQKYDENTKKYVWKNTGTVSNTISNWQSFLYGNVTSLFSINGTSIYENGYEFVDIGHDLSNYKISKVVRLRNGFYFMLENDNSSEWYFCKENSSNVLKLY